MNRKMMKRPPALLLAVLIFLSGCSGFANKGDDSLSINDDLASTVDQMLSEGEGGDIDNADGIDGANGASSPAPVSYAEFSPERGDLAECGLSEEGFSLINDIIENDLSHGGTSAQLAVIKDRKLVYENAWGKLNSYEKDGMKSASGKEATTDTLYDLASVTKMFAVNYAVQKLVDEGLIDINASVSDYLGYRFFLDSLGFCYKDGQQVDIPTQKVWKSRITVRDLLTHQAGFPADPRYFNPYVDAVTQEFNKSNTNILYAGNDGSDETRRATIEAIFKTPLLYEPGTKTLYSDVDYMILGEIIERVSGKDLDTYLKDNFTKPMGLKHVTFNPLENGFEPSDCAATELNGNTRDGTVSFPGIRTDTLQGQVHDEKAYYSMGGISGHAGLFSNATDLALLASLMIDGTYQDKQYFSKDVIDMFTAPKSEANPEWGLGWYRRAGNKRVQYFGSLSSQGTIGHQGWTGTLIMIDRENDLVVAYLTNKINSPVTDRIGNNNKFDAGYLTFSSLGFVNEIIYRSLGGGDVKGKLDAYMEELIASEKEDAAKYPTNHPLKKSVLSLEEVRYKHFNNGYLNKARGDGVILGDIRFDKYLSILGDKRVAVYSNQSGITGDFSETDISGIDEALPSDPGGEHIIDALIKQNVDVTLVFSPEHGFAGGKNAGAKVKDEAMTVEKPVADDGDDEEAGAGDKQQGITIASLYDDTSTPTAEELDKFDVLVVDIQDVGVRYYTYYITMYHLMDSCAANGKKVVVLDRPNPNGFYVDGPILKDGFSSGVGNLKIPVVHGMTIGELALMINGEGWLKNGKCDLAVVPCLYYSHDKKTYLKCRPSPNLKDMRAVYLYPSLCYFENTAVSVGRGTDNPFDLYGSPYLSGVSGYDFTFVPKSMEGASSPLFEGKTCYGKDLRGLSEDEVTKGGIDLTYLINAYKDVTANAPDTSFFGKADDQGRYYIDKLFGTDEVRKMITDGKSVDEIRASWKEEDEEFLRQRRKYLIYD